MKYQMKPLVVDAIQWDGNEVILKGFLEPRYQWEYQSRDTREIVIMERAVEQRCKYGDWIVRDISGAVEIVSDWLFKNQYEPVEVRGY